MQAAVDFGLSNTDVVAIVDGVRRHWTFPFTSDPTPASVNELLAAGGIDLTALRTLAVTGGKHRHLPERIGDCRIVAVNEVQAIGRGGQALVNMMLPEDNGAILVVSAGSGTALVSARGHDYAHVTGTAVGGGTMMGLGRLLLGTADPREINTLAMKGNPNGADLSLGDVITGPIGHLPAEATAVNFGRLGREVVNVSREDLAAALVTMVGQVITIVAINAARAIRAEKVVITGHLIDMESIRTVLESVEAFYGAHLELPPNPGSATALGALLLAGER